MQNGDFGRLGPRLDLPGKKQGAARKPRAFQNQANLTPYFRLSVVHEQCLLLYTQLTDPPSPKTARVLYVCHHSHQGAMLIRLIERKNNAIEGFNTFVVVITEREMHCYLGQTCLQDSSLYTVRSVIVG